MISNQIFHEGYLAAKSKAEFSDCPYSPNGSYAIQWQAGWIAANEELEPAKPVGFYITTIFLIALILWAIIMLTILS